MRASLMAIGLSPSAGAMHRPSPCLACCAVLVLYGRSGCIRRSFGSHSAHCADAGGRRPNHEGHHQDGAVQRRGCPECGTTRGGPYASAPPNACTQGVLHVIMVCASARSVWHPCTRVSACRGIVLRGSDDWRCTLCGGVCPAASLSNGGPWPRRAVVWFA